MIKALLRREIRRFGARYGYDVGFMEFVTDSASAAGMRLSLLPLFSQYRGPAAARDVRFGASLGSTLDGDCGPCVQLVVDMALEAGVPAGDLALCLQGRASEAGETGLGFRFAQAAILEAPELDQLRAEIDRRFGAEALVACCFAASSGRVYPVLKRGLGFGKTCVRVEIAGNMIRMAPSQ